jgi:hypothetical protein
MRRRIAAALRSIRAFAYIAMSIANVIALPVRAAMIPRPETPAPIRALRIGTRTGRSRGRIDWTLPCIGCVIAD